MAKAAGCAAKLNPATLDAVLRKLPRQTDPDVLVGFETNDDAGIYRLTIISRWCKQSISSPRLLTNPSCFGEIAAANALSDVYAMGGRPISSLSIVGFPEKGDPEYSRRNHPRRPRKNDGSELQRYRRTFDPQ